jgi:hypothetical protein
MKETRSNLKIAQPQPEPLEPVPHRVKALAANPVT